MNKEKIRPLLYGLAFSIPFVLKMRPQKKVGGATARYCYSVWMRHLVRLMDVTPGDIPKKIAEIGPGNSIGCGMAALLCGCEKYYGLDVVSYWDKNNINLKVFDDMVELFRTRATIPDNTEFPRINPVLDNYNFPDHLLTDELLCKALAPERIEKIRGAISQLHVKNDSVFFTIYNPWYDSKIIAKETIDFIFSQAVFEHVDDLETAYNAMQLWLKPNGFMAHSIDFWSHGITSYWDGYRMFSSFEWKIVKGRRPFLINRAPLSKHIHLHEKNSFEIREVIGDPKAPATPEKDIAKEFKNLTFDDRNNISAYILSQKKQS